MGLFLAFLKVGSCPHKKRPVEITAACFHRPDEMPSCHSTNSIKAPTGTQSNDINHTNHPVDVILLDPTR